MQGEGPWEVDQVFILLTFIPVGQHTFLLDGHLVDGWVLEVGRSPSKPRGDLKLTGPRDATLSSKLRFSGDSSVEHVRPMSRNRHPCNTEFPTIGYTKEVPESRQRNVKQRSFRRRQCNE